MTGYYRTLRPILKPGDQHAWIGAALAVLEAVGVDALSPYLCEVAAELVGAIHDERAEIQGGAA